MEKNFLDEEKKAFLERFRQELVISGYSSRTTKMYLLYVKEFFENTPKKVTEIERQDIVSFLAGKKERNASNATVSLVHSALKFFLLARAFRLTISSAFA